MNGVVKFLISCVKRGSGMKDISEETKEAYGHARDLSKGLMALGNGANIAGKALKTALTGGIFEMAGAAVGFIIDKWKEWREAAKEAAREAAKAIADKLSAAAERVERRFKRLTEAIANAAARAKDMRKLGDAEADYWHAHYTAQRKGAERDELAHATTESEKAVIKANYALKYARLETAKEVQLAERDYQDALAEVANAEKRRNAARDAELAAEGRLGEARARASSAARSKDEERKKIADEAYEKAMKDRAAAEARLAEKEREVASAKIAAETALVKLNTKRIRAGEQTADAEAALAEAKKKHAEAEKKLEEDGNRKAEEEQKRIEEESKKFEAEAKAKRKKQADSILAQEQEKAKEQQKKIGDSIQRLLREIRDIEKARERTRKGMETDHKNHNGLFGPYQYHLDENGNISNFTDWDRADRYAGHDNDEQKAKRRQETDDARMRDIQDRLEAGKYVSEADQKKYDRWRQFKKERDGEEKRKAEIENLQQEQQTAVIESEKHLKKIKEDLAQFVESGVLQ